MKRKMSPVKFRGMSGAVLIISLCLIGLVVVACNALSMDEPSSSLSGSAGIGRSILTQSSTPGKVPSEIPITTGVPVLMEPPIPVDQSNQSTIVSHDNEVTDTRGIPMLLIPAGEYQMGSLSAASFVECQKLYHGGTCKMEWFIDEEPVHTIRLGNYYLDKYEVSNGSYQNCVTDGVCEPPVNRSSSTRSSYYGNPLYNDYPIINVNWDMANSYCSWRGARLPTEAEWEIAARGTEKRIYPWGDIFDGLNVNFCDGSCKNEGANHEFIDGYEDTAPVDSYPAGVSKFGFYNMAGNIWEWVADWYDETYYVVSPLDNPAGPISGEARVVRGGSWNDFGDVVRSSNRNWVRASFSNDMLGFRCAR
jgi:formylglycine-generating enzyme required for sulfatase activity